MRSGDGLVVADGQRGVLPGAGRRYRRYWAQAAQVGHAVQAVNVSVGLLDGGDISFPSDGRRRCRAAAWPMETRAGLQSSSEQSQRAVSEHLTAAQRGSSSSSSSSGRAQRGTARHSRLQASCLVDVGQRDAAINVVSTVRLAQGPLHWRQAGQGGHTGGGGGEEQGGVHVSGGWEVGAAAVRAGGRCEGAAPQAAGGVNRSGRLRTV